jgi:subtilase family serine protease
MRGLSFVARLVTPLALLGTLTGGTAAATVAAATGSMTPSVGAHPKPELADPAVGANAQFGCQTRPLDGPRARCYSPQQIRAAYEIQAALDAGNDGSGRTIVIVDAFDNPYIQTDLDTFDATFGLPDATVDVVKMPGVPAFDINDDNQVNWTGEISLDVQWAHAVAPGAHLVLLETASNDDNDIYAGLKYAVDKHLGDVISMSFGENEACNPTEAKQHRLFQKATEEGITLVASSGDDGSAQQTCDGTAFETAASSPASDPNVLSVGGTTLSADSDTGAYLGETAWMDPFSGCPAPDFGCSGGGFSKLYKKPGYQKNAVAGTMRGVPDVAYNGGVAGGVLTHWGVGLATLGLDPTTPLFFIFGGTSAGAPQWAGIVALAGQREGDGLGRVNDKIYSLASSKRSSTLFRDITVGTNVIDPSIAGFNAGAGWDAVTGVGTPRVSALVKRLADS